MSKSIMNLKNWRTLEQGNELAITSCPIFSANLPELQYIDYDIMLNPSVFRDKHKL